MGSQGSLSRPCFREYQHPNQKKGFRLHQLHQLTEVDGEGAPLDGGGVEVAVLNVQVPRRDGL